MIDDPFDGLLRQVMQSRPDDPAPADLARRAIERAARPAFAIRPRANRLQYAWWGKLITGCAALVAGLMMWYAAEHLSHDANYAFASGDTVTNANVADLAINAGSPQSAVAPILGSDQAAFASLGILLALAVMIAVQRALTCDRSPLALS